VITLVVDSPSRPIAFPLTGSSGEIIAGSLPDHAIYLPYKGISRRHFGLSLKDGVWWIRDLESTNGILINGKKTKEAKLRVGDMIQAGTVQIRVESSEEFQSIEAPPSSDASQQSQETDKVGMVPLKSAGPVYSFPKLTFPEGFLPCNSQGMLDIFRKIYSVRESDANVLLVGETGTGKDMIARTLHLSSKRSKGPFIAINCAAIPEELAEAELFGIGDKVATNVSKRIGKIAQADKGTLFLDELSAFPYELQAKVLRALQDKSVTPIGESRSIPVDFRLISATNLEPSDLIQAKKLREDLYHRLATVEITLPPLRERKEDLEVLIPPLLLQLAQLENKRVPGISKRLMSLLIHYPYPGNMRELTNILRSMVALAHPGEILDVHLIPGKILEPQDASSLPADPSLAENPYDLRKTVNNLTKGLIVQALSKNDGNVKKTASYLKISTFGLRKMMKRLGIQK